MDNFETEILQLIRQSKLKNAMELLLSTPGLTSAEVLHASVKELYWKQKDIDSVVEIAETGICNIEVWSESAPDSQTKVRFLSIAKAISYDLGSFTWPGWDEPGIELNSTHILAGSRAAKKNYEWAVSLQKPPLALARAWWLLYAFSVVYGDYVEARKQLEESRKLALIAGTSFEILLAEGSVLLVDALESRSSLSSSRLKDWMEKQESDSTGADVASQLRIAWNVFKI